ncbi:unnamed protein product [Brassica oleracea var. botrytis]|uniref:Uncharacterized protein n=2 Tax=Brassica TaxID=3705 RepID=A0A8S9LSY0_BRACR|nr:hypothetical protein F2Q68_00043258 [Brassica cretica]VDD59888.1 unnamed protein product [Brassica oleracea]
MDKTALIKLSYRRSRASCIGLDVVTGDVSRRSVYSGLKDETFSELEPKLYRGYGVGGAGEGGSNGGNVVM